MQLPKLMFIKYGSHVWLDLTQKGLADWLGLWTESWASYFILSYTVPREVFLTRFNFSSPTLNSKNLPTGQIFGRIIFLRLVYIN